MREKRRTLLAIILVIGIVLSGTAVFALNESELFDVQSEPAAISSITPEEAHDLLNNSAVQTQTNDEITTVLTSETGIANDNNVINERTVSDIPADTQFDDNEVTDISNASPDVDSIEPAVDNASPDAGNVAPTVDNAATTIDKPVEGEQTTVTETNDDTQTPGSDTTPTVSVDIPVTNNNNQPQNDDGEQSSEQPSQTQTEARQEQPEYNAPPTQSSAPLQNTDSLSAEASATVGADVLTPPKNTAAGTTDIAQKPDGAVNNQPNVIPGTGSGSAQGTASDSNLIIAPGKTGDNNIHIASSQNNSENGSHTGTPQDGSDKSAQASSVTENTGSGNESTGVQETQTENKDAIVNSAPKADSQQQNDSPSASPSPVKSTADKKPESTSTPAPVVSSAIPAANKVQSSFIEERATPKSGGAAPTPQAPVTTVVKAAKPQTATKDNNVKILITDTKNKPIKGARIQIPKLGIVTDKKGLASASLPPGVYTYVIKADGYKNLTGKLTVTSKGTKELHFYLKNNETAPSSDPNARYSAVLKFENINNSNMPAENVRVTINGNVLYTNIMGTVVLNDLPPGTYTLSIGGDNYYETQYTLTIGKNNVYKEIGVSDFNNNQIGGYYYPSGADLPLTNSGVTNITSEASPIPYITLQPTPAPEPAPQQTVSVQTEPAPQPTNTAKPDITKPENTTTYKPTATKKPAVQSSKPSASATAAISPKKSNEPTPTTLKNAVSSVKPTEDTEIVAPKNSINPMATLSALPSEIPSPEPSKTPEPTASPTPTVQGKLFNIGFNFTNLDGTAVSDAEVELHSDVMKAKTDKDGYVVFKDVPGGEHNLYIMDESGEIAVTKAFTLAEGVKTELDISSVGGDKIFAGMGTDNLTIDAVVDGKLMAFTTIEEGLNPKAAPEQSNKTARTEDSNLMWMLIVSVAAAVIAIVVLIVAIRRMKKSKVIDVRSAEPVGDTIVIAGKRKKGIKLFK